jgi:hypothetical protein
MSKAERICGIYALVSGIAIPVLWGILLATGLLAQDQTQPIYFTLLITGEMLTMLVLLVAGIGMLLKKSIGISMFPVSMGMLVYATLLGMGKFGQKGYPGLMFFFGVIALASVVITGIFLRWRKTA